METPACDELLRRLRIWVAVHYDPAGSDRRSDELFWDEAIGSVLGGPFEGGGAPPLRADERELLLAAFRELAGLAKAADDRPSPREASDEEATAAAFMVRVFPSKGDFLGFTEHLADLDEDDEGWALAYYPVVNWVTNICGGLMDMTFDLGEARKVSEVDSDSIRQMLGLP
ncbi:MAG TPA: hypothetical protein VF964_08300 [Vicinamibacteria bacterium]